MKSTFAPLPYFTPPTDIRPVEGFVKRLTWKTTPLYGVATVAAVPVVL